MFTTFKLLRMSCPSSFPMSPPVTQCVTHWEIACRFLDSSKMGLADPQLLKLFATALLKGWVICFVFGGIFLRISCAYLFEMVASLTPGCGETSTGKQFPWNLCSNLFTESCKFLLLSKLVKAPFIDSKLKSKQTPAWFLCAMNENRAGWFQGDQEGESPRSMCSQVQRTWHFCLQMWRKTVRKMCSHRVQFLK